MRKSICKAALIAAFVVSFSTLPTSSYAFSPEAQQMCTGDAFRLCSSEIPDIPRVTTCMIKNRASLSSGCRAVMDHDQAAQPNIYEEAAVRLKTASFEKNAGEQHCVIRFTASCRADR
jgi:hypothetical protein